MSRPSVVGSGQFWMVFWSFVTAIMLAWGLATFAFWLDSIRNLNAISVVTAWLSAAAGFQATLSMRKADPEDPL
jgi:hypothetical protein